MGLTAIAQAVEIQVVCLLEDLEWKLEQGELTSMLECHRSVEETVVDDHRGRPPGPRGEGESRSE